ncbi:hypothetical protein [Saccharophagus degradans]|uniref:Uncharacterized protein n=1 Tax=Saccharophagus degradans (strain 2-40 / ATCC 43961 / DSM 17024) TaxID=203122 RepID=Q21NL7_SACD2|nr:hypothetical protein [Saccharophagus degradans]ABD79712.1 hypothetical protein Sde_0448 [Saccharophagus degradans 2-40]
MRLIVFLWVAIIAVPVFSETTHSDKKVKIIHSGDTRDCFFFQLENVSQADPVSPNNEWFAVPFSKMSSDAVLSILMASKASGGSVKVNTTGSTVCGAYAEVKNVSWLP